jgi:hypothetical protein
VSHRIFEETMAVPVFEILILVIGIIFGYMRPGKEDKWSLLKNGIIIGIVLGIIFGIIAAFLIPGGIGLAVGILGAIGIFIEIIILVIIFIIGVFIGDWLEGMKR